MAKMGKVDFRELKELQKRLEKAKMKRIPEEVINRTANELMLRLWSKVVKRTPVGDYTVEKEMVAKRDTKNHKKGEHYIKRVADGSGRKGGTLRRGWDFSVKREGNKVIITAINPVEYASYVEYGHRQEPGRYVPAIGKKLKAGWVPGQFMLTKSVDEILRITPKVFEKQLNKYLDDLFNGNGSSWEKWKW